MRLITGKTIKSILLVCFFAQSQLAHSENALTILTKNPQQGSMIIAQLNGEGDVYFKEKKLDKTSQGLVVFGVGRDEKNTIELEIRTVNKQQTLVVPISLRQWKVERVDGLPPSKVTPKSKQTLERISREAKQVRTARNTKTLLDNFSSSFIMPAKGRISGVYGSQRVLNGEPKRPHFGLDIANKTGTPVIAPSDGKVLLAHPDMFYSGGTLVIDHGFGISSTYIHLSSIDVKVGQQVKQGDLIAKIGASGRATGPHLDWRLNWFQTRLDPYLLIENKDQ